MPMKPRFCIDGMLRATRVMAALGAALLAGAGAAQSVATGDGRGMVAEPTFPAVCTQVPADLTISGGEPSSELNTATDTAALQTALSSSGCLGKAVEVTLGSGGQNAMVIAPIAIPATVTLLVDGGVTLFGSRVAADYQIGTAGSGTTCGSTDGGTGCYPLITLGQSAKGNQSSYTGTTVTGLMGYGVINGRGGDKLITISGSTVTPGTSNWWDLDANGTADAPILLTSYKVAAAELYKITLLNSPHFHVKITGQGSTSKTTNFTVWGLKLLTPYTAKNTDGIDPTAVVNMTVKNSLLGDGDDESAISGSSLTQNFTYDNLLLSSGHGLSIGSITSSAVTNVLYNNVNFSGPAADANDIALRIKSYCGSGGGLVSQVTYQNACIQNVKAAIELDPYYSTTSSTTGCPVFGSAAAPITYQNIYVVTPASYINLQGYNNGTSADYANVVLNNVYVNGSLALNRIQSSDVSATPGTPAYANLTLNGSYFPAGWGTLASTLNAVTETVNGTTAASFPTSVCANAFPTLLGEVFASTTTGGATTNNINTATTVMIPATVTLNAMVLPTTSQVTYSGYTGSAAPTAGVQFYDGTTLLGTASLGANGTLASYTVTNPTAGVHTYTASYVGDSTYPATLLGANIVGSETQQVQVTVNAGPAAQLVFTTAPASSPVYGTSPGTVAVQVQDAAGDASTSSTAAVTLTVTGPNGYSGTYTANAASGTATFSALANPPSVGVYTYTAASSGLTTATANETVSAATLTVAAQAAQRVFDVVNPAFVYGITGFVNGDSSSVVSGAPLLSTMALRNSTAGVGYPVSVAQNTLSAANYNFMTLGSTLTVNGGAQQLIRFALLPNLASGGSYQLTASASSGLPVTYSVSGPATVNGSTLTVTGPGAVTVTASQAGNVDYAAATSVAQSITAQ
jgi:hypothetical protein